MKKKIISLVIVLIILWIGVFSVDYYTVFHEYKTPPFTIKDSMTSYDDGGSGTYVGFGYKYEIKGNFMPDSDYELDGVIICELFVFNIPITNFHRME